jgi:hypothetical protein
MLSVDMEVFVECAIGAGHFRRVDSNAPGNAKEIDGQTITFTYGQISHWTTSARSRPVCGLGRVDTRPGRMLYNLYNTRSRVLMLVRRHIAGVFDRPTHGSHLTYVPEGSRTRRIVKLA